MSRESLSKSEMIRRHLTEHPDAGPTEVSNFLNGTHKNLNVTPSLVSLVKSKMGSTTKAKATNGRRKNKITRSSSSVRKNPNGSVTFTDLLEAKEIVNRLGGIDRTKEILDEFQQLQLS